MAIPGSPASLLPPGDDEIPRRLRDIERSITELGAVNWVKTLLDKAHLAVETGALHVLSALTVAGSTDITGATDIDGTLNIGAATTIGGTLTVTGHTWIAGVDVTVMLTSQDASLAGLDIRLDAAEAALVIHWDNLVSHAGTLASHESALASHWSNLVSHGGTLASHGGTLASHESTLASHGSRLSAAEADINNPDFGFGAIQADLGNLSYRISALGG